MSLRARDFYGCKFETSIAQSEFCAAGFWRLSLHLREKLRPLPLQSFDQPPGQRVALLLMRLLETGQLLVYLGQALSVRCLGIGRGKRGIGLSLLSPGRLSRLALDGARVIGDGAANGFLDGGLKWVDLAGHEIVIAQTGVPGPEVDSVSLSATDPKADVRA